jgi:hypothetical protein
MAREERPLNNAMPGAGSRMSLISSTLTFYYKHLSPIIWIGGCTVVGGLGLYAALSKGSGLFPFVVIMPIIFVLGIYFMKKYVFDLVDEVWDDGDTLVVKNKGQEQRIALADITNVSYSPMTSPPRVVLSLRHPTVFGDQVAFCAPVQIMTFATSPAITDLIKRVERARESHHRR